MQRILRIKQRRSISRVVVIKTVAPIGSVLPAKCFAAFCMTSICIIVISEQVYRIRNTKPEIKNL